MTTELKAELESLRTQSEMLLSSVKYLLGKDKLMLGDLEILHANFAKLADCRHKLAVIEIL